MFINTNFRTRFFIITLWLFDLQCYNSYPLYFSNNKLLMYQAKEDKFFHQIKQWKTQTPQTAESEHQNNENNIGKSLFDRKQFCRFSDSQDPEAKCEDEPSGYRRPKLDSLSTCAQDQQIVNCEKQKYIYPFSILFNVSKGDGEMVKAMTKKIETIIEQQKQITCIFDRQHESFIVESNQIYLQASLVTSQGFTRNFWKKQIGKCFTEKTQLTVIESDQLGIKLNVSNEIRKNVLAKPLCIMMPTQIIENIMDEKFQLLNKSDLLNYIDSVNSLQGILYELSKQNMGSRIIQKLLCKSSQEQIVLVIQQLKPHIIELVLHKYGNYIFQRLFQFSSSQKKQLLLKIIQPKINEIIKSKAGTFTLQCIIKKINHQEFYYLLEVIKPSLIELSMDQFGNHFVKQLLMITNDEQVNYLFLSNFEILSKHKFGIVALKAFIKSGVKNPMIRQQINNSAQYHFNSISVDGYGHYIIEELFKYYNAQQLTNILSHIVEYVVFFAQDQYSSSIIKRSLELFGDHMAIPIANCLINQGLNTLMETNPGGFILHRLLDNLRDMRTKDLLTSQMKGLSSQINSYQKKIKWQKFLGIL